MTQPMGDRRWFELHPSRTFRLRSPIAGEPAVLVLACRIPRGVWLRFIRHPSEIATPYLDNPTSASEEMCQQIGAALEPAPEPYRGFNGYGGRLARRIHRCIPAIALDEPGL